MLIKQRVGITLILSLMLLTGCSVACRVFQLQAVESNLIETEFVEIEPATLTPMERVLISTATPETESSPTLIPVDLPQETPDKWAIVSELSDAELRELLSQVIRSGRWESLNLPDEIARKWEDFAQEVNSLSDEETELLIKFLTQWGELDRLVEKQRISNGYTFGFRARVIELEGGVLNVVLYIVDESANPARYLLMVKDAQNQAIGWMPAPIMAGLTPDVYLDSQYLAYRDARRRIMLLADGIRLLDNSAEERALRERLLSFYTEPENQNATDFPRYHLPIQGIDTSFYALETSLTTTQIILLNEAFELFDRPVFEGLKDDFFNQDISILIIDQIGKASGLTYTGTGIIEIDRSDLFGNRYHLASVLAHEGSHVLQGAVPEEDVCSEILRREVGDQRIPEGFLDWSSDELVTGIREKRIGAYHVSYWFLAKLGFKDLGDLREVIQTGMVNGHSVVIACD